MQRNTVQPWGRLAGLLAASLATLLGMSRELDPDVILMRACVAGVIVGAVIALLSGILSRMAQDD